MIIYSDPKKNFECRGDAEVQAQHRKWPEALSYASGSLYEPHVQHGGHEDI